MTALYMMIAYLGWKNKEIMIYTILSYRFSALEQMQKGRGYG